MLILHFNVAAASYTLCISFNRCVSRCIICQAFFSKHRSHISCRDVLINCDSCYCANAFHCSLLRGAHTNCYCADTNNCECDKYVLCFHTSYVSDLFFFCEMQ
ncbi:hypothetical protein D3C72_1547900 [compost metagenome]